jgi:hypothetical protein
MRSRGSVSLVTPSMDSLSSAIRSEMSRSRPRRSKASISTRAGMRALSADSDHSTCSSRCGLFFTMRARPWQSARWMVTPRPSVR